MNKSLWMILLTAALAFTMTACGGDEESNGDNGDAEMADENNADTPECDPEEVGSDCYVEPEPEPEPEPSIPFPECQYPAHGSLPASGQVMPEMSWKNARNWDGTEFEFGLRDVYCNPAYDGINTLVFMVTAGWCPACPENAQYLSSLYEAFQDAGTMIIWMESEDDDSLPATSEQAHDEILGYIGSFGPGIRVGDADTEPGMMFYGNRFVQAFPTTFVVRTSDMRIIHDSSKTPFRFPALQVARHPEADWNDTGNNILPTTVGEPCGTEMDCDTGTLNAYCIPPYIENGQLWPEGYCIAFGCETDAACGAGNHCIPDQSGTGLCYAGCTADSSSCRTNYTCEALTNVVDGPMGCVPE